jgi:hypothetical protein
MRFPAAAVAVLGFLAILPCPAQSTQSDSQTLQAILTELRAIREEVKLTESTQILLTELQLQQNVVNRATQRVDDEQAHLQLIQVNEKNIAAELASAQDDLDQTTDPEKKTVLPQKIADLKHDAGDLKTAELSRTDALQKAQENLRNAQDQLDTIQDELNSIVKRLTPAPK